MARLGSISKLLFQTGATLFIPCTNYLETQSLFLLISDRVSFSCDSAYFTVKKYITKYIIIGKFGAPLSSFYMITNKLRSMNSINPLKL